MLHSKHYFNKNLDDYKHHNATCPHQHFIFNIVVSHTPFFVNDYSAYKCKATSDSQNQGRQVTIINSNIQKFHINCINATLINAVATTKNIAAAPHEITCESICT